MDFICTLYEKHYDYGVGALCNSLVKVNFKGKIIIGYKGKLPFWLTQLKMKSSNGYILIEDIDLEFICLDHIKIHFGYYKPQFVLDCIAQYHELETICYFDPDITLKAQWNFFKKWINSGVALSTDNCYSFLHINHPWRKDWELLFPKFEIIAKPECYINSGFIGLKKSEKEIIQLWHQAVESYIQTGGSTASFERNAECGLKGDQDLLNAALMYFPYQKLSIIGKEAMGFESPNFIMGHAIDGIKPWKKFFLKSLILKAKKISFAEKLFFSNVVYPLNLFSPWVLNKKKLDMLFTIILSRFYD